MEQIFIDRVKIYVKAGDGGRGCHSFHRSPKERFLRPDGGDGGKGGNVIIKTDENSSTLLDFEYKRHFIATSGKHGQGNKKKGKDGRDCLIRVPLGTIVIDAGSGAVLGDLTQRNESFMVARGGRGGRGNSSGGDAQPGEQGEEKTIILELKLIADVGLIGYPNVGKSTLINRIANTKSKVASYPFTTRIPILGRVELEDADFSFIVADIPGLVEGAHRGRGLGDKFLRHIERTKLILHIIDISQTEGRDAFQDYLKLNRELTHYSLKLREKPQIPVANKIDLPGSRKNFKNLSRKLKEKVYPISALTGEGIKELLEAIKGKLD